MPKYIDAKKLYERIAELEAQAMAQVEKLNKIPLEEMTKGEYIEWRVWSAILGERSAFKYDVFDAPTTDVVEVVRCKDCRHSYTDIGNDKDYHCELTPSRAWHHNHFCSAGERRHNAKSN